ncbi:hypothetical protein [Sphingomonas crocodyli]|uniref:Cellulose-binding protein n=1 Tax=Sphingomonas crocodyli TaxID=1979270 RepID=A0A437MB44_9SPHN|nr:hypothetical protein [Sphingomonas crocodyli]RVT94867.1 hypothetical protein EOD43_13965 [Sphingomonas crocodyli]
MNRSERGALLLFAAAIVAVLAVGSTIWSTVARAQGVPPTRLGINLNSPAFWMESRSYTNLAVYAHPNTQLPGQGYKKIEPQQVGPGGWPSKLPAGATATVDLFYPLDAKPGQVVRCTWQGQAKAWAADDIRMLTSGPNMFEFAFTREGRNAIRGTTAKPPRATMWFGDVVDTVSDVDCREADRPRDQVFDPAFVRSLAPFRVVRFMEWMNVNGQRPFSAANDAGSTMPRNYMNSATVRDMMALVRQANVDPWFALPYDSTDDYIRSFAQRVHDTLPPGRTVYVEIGNEAWHGGFFTGQRAMADGKAAGLGRYPYEGQLMQYALRAKRLASIWSRVFADRPRDLVRVYSGNLNYLQSLEIIEQNDVAPSIDAIAVAPYFGEKVFPKDPKLPRPGIDQAFVQLDKEVDATVAQIGKAKAVADRLGKRLIAYEGGAHLLIAYDVPLLDRMNHDPRMADAYTKLLTGWAREAGDVFAIYSLVGGSGAQGGFGLRDYDGAPLSESPKARAVEAFAKSHAPGK